MRRPGLYSGLLCVVDLRADPVATYEALLSFRPPTIDFLLPHANWMSPPPRVGGTAGAVALYARWLIAIFDRWYDSPIRETRIRIFEEIVNLLLGGKSATEVVGLTPTSLIVIETDGSIEQSDALKSTYHDAARTGLHIVRDSFDAALQLPEIAARQLGLDALSDECLTCRIRRICGGGLYAHRYRERTGFRNRSVYCDDLYALIMHIRERISRRYFGARATLGQKVAENSTLRSIHSLFIAANVSGCSLPSTARRRPPPLAMSAEARSSWPVLFSASPRLTMQ